MAAALSGFQLASELGPSPSREAELEDLCSRQAAQLERLQDSRTENIPAPKSPPVMRPEEKQALVQLLSDLSEKVKALELLTARQARQIEYLEKSHKEVRLDIEWIQESFPPQIAESKRRLKALEEGPNCLDNTTVQSHITALFDHMEAIGRKQVSFREASKCLRLSKSRVLQFKTAIAMDSRFIIVHSESHKQKSLIRLRKYFDGNAIVQPPN